MDISKSTQGESSPAPLLQSDRIKILDSLRGIAILGILLMNIPGFGIPYIQIFDLSVKNELSGWNFKSWLFIDGVMEGSMRGLFSMLFGAGMILFISRLQKKQDGLMTAEIYYRRLLWLLLFGLINAYVFLWFWDILFMYAVCGMILFVFRRYSAKCLLIASLVCLVLTTVRENRDLYKNKADISKGEQFAALDTSKTKLTDYQKEKVEAMSAIKERSTSEFKQKQYAKQLRKGRGSLEELYEQNTTISAKGHTVVLYYFFIWDILTFMFLGMAFYKSQILTGAHPMKTYLLLMIGGLAIGLVISYFRLSHDLRFSFNNYNKIKNTVFEYYELSRFFRSVGIFGLIMVLYKTGMFSWLFKLMQPVGQMAFSNYLMQSIICGLYFFGVGFGQFGTLERYELYYVVLIVWVFQIIFSHLWLRFFLFGPFEWLWRSLTYWKVQPMLRHG